MKCPECANEMRWLSDDQDGNSITQYYDCSKCNIEVTKTKKEELLLNN